jgi:hypothetical protein
MDENTQNFIIRLINIIALLAAVAWLVSSPGWEPAVAMLGALAVLVGLEYKEFSQRNNASVDRKLFEQFLELLPSNGAIEFVSTFDFGGIFFHDRLENLRTFRATWDNPEHEFLNRTLESKRKEFYQAVDDFMSHISANTFPLEDGKQAVPREWEYKQPKRYHEAVESINNSADKVSKKHKELVRIARKKLKV